jgi:methionine--tRNA ligase beta chain
VAGVAQSYTPEEMIGKTIVVVSNLKPATIRGLKSNGMLLAVKTESGHTLLTISDEAKPGLRIS